MTGPEMAQPFAHRRWQTLALGFGVLALVGVHAPILGYKKLVDVDEGYALSIAERLLEGFKLYDGAVSQRGPLMYYGYELMAALTGWDSALGLRCWALAFAIGNVLMVYWAGARLLSRSVGVVAALLMVYALGFGMPLRDSVALHGETMQLPLLILSVVQGALAMRAAPGSSDRVKRLAVAGVAMGMAICIKQSVVLHPVPLALWIVLDAHKNRRGAGAALRELAVFALGVSLVPALFIVHAASTGTLGQMYYYCVRYNLEVHLRATGKSVGWVGPMFDRLNERTAFFVAIALVAAVSFGFVRRRVQSAWRARSAWVLGRAYGPRVYLGLHLVLALVTASSMSRFFPHYFIQALPFLTLLVAACFRRVFDARDTGALARRVAMGGALFLVAYGGLAAYFEEKIDGRVGHDPLVERLAAYIEAATTPDQRIFVWGFSPWLYTYSHRRPAGRYVFETYVTGFVPWFFEEPEAESKRIVPGSVEALLSDLDREKPALVIDAGAVMLGRPMRAYERPAAWLHEHYCFSFRFSAYDVYTRKGVEPCEVPYFPRSPAAVTFYGGVIPILMPLLVDRDTSRWLPPTEFDKPSMFPGQTAPVAIDAIRDRKRELEVLEALIKVGITSPTDLLPPAPCQNVDAAHANDHPAP